MKVSEFLEMGGEFVDGDVVGHGETGVNVNAELANGINYNCEMMGIDVISFAWREGLALDKPFAIVSDVIDGKQMWKPALIPATLNMRCATVKIEQLKPTYTQAMHDAGELPSAGTTAMYKIGDGWWFECFIINILNGTVYMTCPHLADDDDFKGYQEGKVDRLSFKPIKTDKEEAVEFASSKLKQSGNKLVEGLLGELYDADLLR